MHRAVVQDGDAGVFRVSEVPGPRTCYFSLRWLMWGEYDQRIDSVRAYLEGGIAVNATLHLCHTSRLTRDADGIPRMLAEPHASSIREMHMIGSVRAVCRELDVKFSIENCCPQLMDIQPSISLWGSSIPVLPGPSICDGSILRDCTWCPCCSGDCVWPPQDRTLAQPDEDSGHTFRGEWVGF